MKLITKIFFTATAILFVSVVISIYSIRIQLSHNLLDNADSLLTSYLNTLSVRMEQKARNYQSVIQSLATKPFIIAKLKTHHNGAQYLPLGHHTNSWIGIVNKEGALQASNDKNKMTLAQPLSEKLDEFDSLPEPQLTISNSFFNSDTVIRCTMPVKDGKDVLGYIFLEQDISNFTSNPKGNYLFAHREFFYPASGLQIAELKNKLEMFCGKFRGGQLAQPENRLAIFHPGQYLLYGVKYLPFLNSCLVSRVSMQKAAVWEEKINNTVIGVSTLALLVFLVLFYLMIRRILHPLEELKMATYEISRGKFDHPVKKYGPKEVAQLADMIEKMRRYLQKAEQQQKQRQQELTELVSKKTVELTQKVHELEQNKTRSNELLKKLEDVNRRLATEIKKRKEIEDDLRLKSEQYRIISELTSDFAFAVKVSEDGKVSYLWTIGAFEKITGYTIQEVLEMGGWNAIVHPDDVSITIEQLATLMTGQESVAEYRIINKSGETRWLRELSRPTWDNSLNRVTMVYGAVQDISLQKKTEEELRQTEITYRELFENTTDAIYLQEKDGRFITVNRGAEKMYGYPREYFIGKTPEFVSAPGMNDLPEVAKKVEKAFNGEPQVFEFWGIRKNGEIFPKEVRLFKGTFFAKDIVVAMARDITDRKKAEQQLQILSQTIEQSPISVVILTKDEKIEYVNNAFMNTFGYSADEAIDKKIDRFLPEDSSEEAYRTLWQTIRNELPWQGEMKFLDRNGRSLWVEATVGPLLEKDGEISHYILFLIDISTRKELEEQFLQSQKMEAIGRLAGGVAHDFNNLLTVIIGYSELLLASVAPENQIYNKIKQIDRAGRRAEALTRQLLAFSRKQILQPKIIDLNELIRDMEKMLHRLIGEDIHLTAYLGHPIFPIKADPGQIEQIIMNMAINARDAMPEGGELIIETKSFSTKRKMTIQNEKLEPGDYAVLKIRDTGIGMDAKTLKRIFEPFFTTKEQGRGTGLGLSTVYGIIKQSKGIIVVESKPGEGSCFTTYFPAVHETERMEEEKKKELKNLEGKEFVLIVEDEDSLRELAVETLTHFGYRVIAAHNGVEALELCNKKKPSLDLILTDVVMPHMNGKDLIDRLKKICRSPKVIFMSGYTEDTIVHKGILKPETEFIQKPFDPILLARKVREVLDKTT